MLNWNAEITVILFLFLFLAVPQEHRNQSASDDVLVGNTKDRSNTVNSGDRQTHTSNHIHAVSSFDGDDTEEEDDSIVQKSASIDTELLQTAGLSKISPIEETPLSNEQTNGAGEKSMFSKSLSDKSIHSMLAGVENGIKSASKIHSKKRSPSKRSNTDNPIVIHISRNSKGDQKKEESGQSLNNDDHVYILQNDNSFKIKLKNGNSGNSDFTHQDNHEEGNGNNGNQDLTIDLNHKTDDTLSDDKASQIVQIHVLSDDLKQSNNDYEYSNNNPVTGTENDDGVSIENRINLLKIHGEINGLEKQLERFEDNSRHLQSIKKAVDKVKQLREKIVRKKMMKEILQSKEQPETFNRFSKLVNDFRTEEVGMENKLLQGGSSVREHSFAANGRDVSSNKKETEVTKTVKKTVEQSDRSKYGGENKVVVENVKTEKTKSKDKADNHSQTSNNVSASKNVTTSSPAKKPVETSTTQKKTDEQSSKSGPDEQNQVKYFASEATKNGNNAPKTEISEYLKQLLVLRTGYPRPELDKKPRRNRKTVDSGDSWDDFLAADESFLLSDEDDVDVSDEDQTKIDRMADLVNQIKIQSLSDVSRHSHYSAKQAIKMADCLARRKLCELEPTWGEWGPWEACSVSCGRGGYHIQKRVCHRTAVRYCSGNNFQIQECHTNPPCTGRPNDISFGKDIN